MARSLSPIATKRGPVKKATLNPKVQVQVLSGGPRPMVSSLTIITLAINLRQCLACPPVTRNPLYCFPFLPTIPLFILSYYHTCPPSFLSDEK